MVQSTVAKSILGMADILGSGPTTQQRVAADQELRKNQIALANNAAKNLQGDLDAAGKYITYDTTGDGPIAKVDTERVFNERKDLIINAFNLDPRYNMATDENGVRIQTQVSDILKNPDGSYSALVTRPDGRKVPLTENRTASDDDVVVKLSPEDFDSVVNSRVLSGIGRNSMENTASYLRYQGDANRVMLQDALLDRGAETLSDDNAAMAQFFGLVNTADQNTLRLIAKDMGVDVAAIEQQNADKRAEEEMAENPPPKRYSITPARSNKILAIKAQIEEERAKLGTAGGNKAAANVARLKRQLKEEETELYKNHPDYVALKNEARGLIGVQTKEARARKKEIETKLLQETREGIIASVQDADTILANIKGRPDPIPLNAEQLRQAIQDGTAEVTPEQVTAMRTYLQDQNVQSVDDIRKLPTAEQLQVALIASATQSGNNGDRAKYFQETMNQLQRGARDYTLGQEVDDQLAADSNALAAGRLRQSGLDYRLNLAKFQKELRDEAGSAGVEASKLSREIIENIIDEEGNFVTGEDFNKTQAQMNRLVNVAANFDPADPRGSAYRKAAVNALIPYMVALAEKEGTGSKLNPLNWPTKFMNLFRDDSQFIVGNMEDRLEIVTRTVNGKQVPESIRILDNTGVPTDINIPIDDLNLDDGLKTLLVGIPQRSRGQ
ncbi:hypothetical protein [Limnobacter sp.]|uniref:hypothetical protein n=1 Tax=Limnobacter sp. TaxID=2003368 RepID=UPI0025C2A5B8|nr:hypothetical protein [Limnobacter sp.]